MTNKKGLPQSDEGYQKQNKAKQKQQPPPLKPILSFHAETLSSYLV